MTNQIYEVEVIASEEFITNTLAKLTPDEHIATLQEQYGPGNLLINGVEDKEGYKVATDALRLVKKVRTKIEDKRKELKKPFWDMGVAIDNEAKRLTGLVQPIETHLDRQIKAIDDEALRIRRAEELRRSNLLTEAGFQLAGEWWRAGNAVLLWTKVMELTEEELEAKLSEGRAEVARIEAEQEAQRQEAERIAKERAELEALKAQLAAKEAELAAKEAEANKPAPEPTAPAPQEEQFGDIWDEKPAPAPEPQPVKTMNQFINKLGHAGSGVYPGAAGTPTPTGTASPMYLAGFASAKSKVIEILNRPDKFTRGELKQMINDLKP